MKKNRNIFLIFLISVTAFIVTACEKEVSDNQTTTGEEKESTTKFVPTIPVSTEQTTEEVSMVNSSGKIIFPDEKVTKIQIRDGNTGKDYLVTEAAKIEELINEISKVEFVASNEENSGGTSYLMYMLNEENKEVFAMYTAGIVSHVGGDDVIYRNNKTNLDDIFDKYVKSVS